MIDLKETLASRETYQADIEKQKASVLLHVAEARMAQKKAHSEAMEFIDHASERLLGILRVKAIKLKMMGI